MISTTGNFIEHLNVNKGILASENIKNTKEASQNFLHGVATGQTADVAFQNAIKAFQEKMNPAEDMLITSEKIAEDAKNAIKPNSKNLMSWIDTLNASIPMIQVYNEWMNHLNENKHQAEVFYA